MATEPRFVIVGTGRSGTGYISKLLTASGVRCGHEEWWNPRGTHADGLVGDASWLATTELAGYEGFVFHQTRHPLDVITSMVKVELHQPYLGWQQRLTGPLADPVQRSAVAYVMWNLAAERHAQFRWQVEQVTADVLHEIGRRVGRAVRPALGQVRTTVNQHHDRPRIGWGRLGPMEHPVRALAARYGYL